MTPSENVSPRTDVPVTIGRLQTQVRQGGVLVSHATSFAHSHKIKGFDHIVGQREH